jgi:malate dehydrogenase (quinone)
VGRAGSDARHNSQTIHWGDIETDHGPEQSRAARRSAAMLVNYATKLPARDRDRILFRMPKLALAVGQAECDDLRRRWQGLKALYPRLRLLDPRAIADLEPEVALVDGAWRREPILAIGSADDYSAADYGALAESFAHACVRLDRGADRQVTQLYSTEVERIRRDGADYCLDTDRGPLKARSVVVCTGGRGLPLAQGLGLGRQLACLPLAGSFYLTPEVLNGKVVRAKASDRLFPAVHGDRDIKGPGQTRFGPIALVGTLLGRRHRPTAQGLLKSNRGDGRVGAAIADLARVAELRARVLGNWRWEVPGLGRRLLVQEIRQIVPSLDPREIEPAPGLGGVRTQIVDLEAGALRTGEVKLGDGQGLIFNLSPSPGGTGCLGSGETDLRAIARHLGARIDRHALARELLSGRESLGDPAETDSDPLGAPAPALARAG